MAGGKWTIWNQLGVQSLAVTIAIVYAAVMTFVIIYVLNKFIKFKSSEDDEMAGLDRVLSRRKRIRYVESQLIR